MTNTRERREYLDGLSLTQDQREIIIGVMLGDGSMECGTSGKTARLTIEQSKSVHQGYFEHLYELFPGWFPSKAKDVERTSTKVNPDTGENNTNTNLNARTSYHRDFAEFYHLFYKDNKKIIPINISDYLTPKSIAYWYMDDGALKGSDRLGKYLHTEGFEVEQLPILQAALLKFNVKTSLHSKGKNGKVQKAIYIGADHDPIFSELIRPYIIPCMYYKLIPREIEPQVLFPKDYGLPVVKRRPGRKKSIKNNTTELTKLPKE